MFALNRASIFENQKVGEFLNLKFRSCMNKEIKKLILNFKSKFLGSGLDFLNLQLQLIQIEVDKRFKLENGSLSLAR